MIILAICTAVAAFFATGTARANARARKAECAYSGRFLLAFSSMLAMVSQADGKVSADEVVTAERFFANMHLTPAERAMCVGNFVLAQREAGDVKAAAAAIASEMNCATCQFLHGVIWKVAQADGHVDEAERRVLAEIGTALGIDAKAGSRSLSAFNRKALESAGVPPSLLQLADVK